MAITLKVKYFNTFILREKPIVTTATTLRHTESASNVTGESTSVTISASNTAIVDGMIIEGQGIKKDTTVTVSGTTLTLSNAAEIQKGVKLTFYNANPYAYDTDTNNNGVNDSKSFSQKQFHVEESRIRGGFNEDSVDFGVKAFVVDKNYKRKHRENSMIYSGIFNSRTGVNNTNQFSIGQNITKSVDILYGSIQKLHAEDTNLTILQEKKVSRALIDKDAIYTAEGGNLAVDAKIVIGQVQPYSGEYGISKNPESFAVYGTRKYFTDTNKGVVLRLSQDGLTEISAYGMKSFFRDNLKNLSAAYGMFDMHTKGYVLSLLKSSNFDEPQTETTYKNTFGNKVLKPFANYKTLAFDDKVNGWSSFFTYSPEFGGSCGGEFYTWKQGLIYRHHTNNVKNTFYGEFKPSIIKLISNENGSLVKYYGSLNYEGTNNWKAISLSSPADDDNLSEGYPIPGNITGRIMTSTEGVKYVGFTPLEKKYFGQIKINDTTSISGIQNLKLTGIKGYFLTTTLEHQPVSNNGAENLKKHAELFSVGFNYEKSLY